MQLPLVTPRDGQGMETVLRYLVHDLDAVDAYASIVAQTSPDAAELIARISYSAAETPPANHFGLPLAVMTAAAAENWFDCLAIWATMRDRHLPCVLLELTASVAG
jgi:hypothetical protein